MTARQHADRLRKEVAAQPGNGQAMRMLDDAMLKEAKQYDAMGDLLMGLQGDWASMAPLVRRGYQAMAAGYESAKAKAAAAATEEAAA